MTPKKKTPLKQYFVKLLLSFTAIFVSFIAVAQCPDPNNPDCPGDGGPGGDPGVPLTGAQYILLAMGAAFVVFKFWQYHRKNKAQKA